MVCNPRGWDLEEDREPAGGTQGPIGGAEGGDWGLGSLGVLPGAVASVTWLRRRRKMDGWDAITTTIRCAPNFIKSAMTLIFKKVRQGILGVAISSYWSCRLVHIPSPGWWYSTCIQSNIPLTMKLCSTLWRPSIASFHHTSLTTSNINRPTQTLRQASWCLQHICLLRGPEPSVALKPPHLPATGRWTHSVFESHLKTQLFKTFSGLFTDCHCFAANFESNFNSVHFVLLCLVHFEFLTTY